jgi:hypothetical protein
VPIDLGKRVETRAPAPARLAEAAAIAKNAESITAVIEPTPNLRTITLRAVSVETGRVFTRVVTVPAGADTVTPTLTLPAGDYRVEVIGKTRGGSEVRWSTGRHTVAKKKR